MAPKRDAAGQEKRAKDGNAVPLLPHHLNRWAVKNESDFFIHKDLRRFLSGELDYFLKSVVLNLDNLLAAGEQRAEPNFRLLDAVKRLGTEIVDFVSQLEDFQKALFEKKKFVLETSWCLTLDRIPASVKEEVYAAILANDRQWDEWETLYKISQWPADLATVPVRTSEFLEAFPCVMMDTALGYDAILVEGIMCALPDIDAHTDGLIIHSENSQALGVLGGAFGGAVSCIYIDPPYNTDGSPIVYKNSYKSSSWTALVDSRLRACKGLLAPDGVLVAAIDDEQQRELSFVLSSVFAGRLLGTVCVRSNPSGRPTQTGYAVSHEYLLFAGNGEKSRIGRMPPTAAQRARFSEIDDEGPFEWRNLRREGSDSNRSDRRTMYYPIFIAADSIRIPRMRWDESSQEWIVEEEPATGEQVVYPDNEQGEQKRWRWEHPTVTRDVRKLKVRKDRSGRDYVYYKRRPHEEGVVSASSWFDAKYSATEHGTALLKALFGITPFDYPKSIHAVVDSIYLAGGLKRDAVIVDFFGGSGTSGHAVMSLNRGDRGLRKYVLVEMGLYFDTVLKPRLQKVAFSEEWKDGVPARQANPQDPNNPYNGISHCIKVLRLESYEDALDNIEFNIGAAPGAELGLHFRRDYELRYALDWESKACPTRLAVEQLDTPFDYTLTLRRESGTVEVKPDLPETFAYLIGLHTRRRFRTERDDVSYLIYTGTLHEDGTEVAVLWRTCKDWTEANLKAEMDWWRGQRETLAPGATRIYVNGASAIEGHHSLDAEFKTRMHGGTV